jgi:hypothetical protein
LKGKANAARKTVVPNTLLYLFSPIAFVVFLFLTGYLLLSFPWLLFFFALLVVPQVRFYFYEIFENNLLLFASLLAVLFGKKFSIWAKPEDRLWLTKENLSFYGLI